MNKIARISLLLVTVFLCSFAGANAQNTLDAALKKASEEDKVVFMNFSGSDWCRSCILLKKTILNTEEFTQFANKNLIVLDIDFPRSKKNQLSKEQVKVNESLAAKYNSKGQFPTVILMDKNGKILGKTGYKKLSPAQYIEHIKSFLN